MIEANDGTNVLNLDEARKRKAEVDEAEKYITRLRRAQHMLAAIVRKAGRVRISRAELEAVGNEARFAVQMNKDGDVILTFVG